MDTLRIKKLMPELDIVIILGTVLSTLINSRLCCYSDILLD